MRTSDKDGGVETALNWVLCDFARAVGEAQDIVRRLGFLAAGVEESVENVVDFHATVETLISAAPVTDTARAMRERLSDEDRELLWTTRAARNELVYDFFLDHPLLQDGPMTPDGERADPTVISQARERLDAITAILARTRDLVNRLEADMVDAGLRQPGD